jgi:hypothetical protein
MTKEVPMSLLPLWHTARNHAVPLIGILSLDPAASADWITTASPDDAPVVQWDAHGGLHGKNSLGQAILQQLTGTSRNEELRSATLDPSHALRVIHSLPPYSVAVMLQLHRYLQHGDVVQGVWNCRDPFKADFRTLVLIGADLTLPPDLSHDVIVWEEPLPSEADIVKIVHNLTEPHGVLWPDEATLRKIIDLVRGLPAFTVEQALALSLSLKGFNLAALWRHKRRLIENTRGLSVWDGTETFAVIGGQAQLIRFLSDVFTGEDPPAAVIRVEEIDKLMAGAGGQGPGDNTGVAQDLLQVILTAMEDHEWSGMILMGPPGAGKSLVSKAVAGQFGVPGITLDTGATRHPHLGQSEQYIRACMRAIDHIAGRRAYWIATCNGLETLRPELIRRFTDGLWFVDLPTQDEQAQIWRIQRARYRIPEDDPAPTFETYTGADIRNICRLSRRLRQPLRQAAQYIVPVAQSDPGGIARLRDLAHEKFLSASYPGPYRKPGGATVTPRGRALSLGE